MTENNTTKQRRGVTLRTPEDVRRIIQRIASRAFVDGSELDNAGKISQLLGCWLKAWEMDKLSDIEKRLAVLEAKEEK